MSTAHVRAGATGGQGGNATTGGVAMPRIECVRARKANPLVRLEYALSRRRLGRDVEPVGVYAHAPSLLLGYGMFEQATAKQDRAEERLKALAETKVAAVVSSEFCCDIASSLARAAGISERQLPST